MTAADELSIRLLGPLELWHGGRPLRLPRARPRTLILLLAQQVGRWRENDELIDILWDGRPPRSALSNLRTFVCQWRKILEPLREQARIDSARGAYLLSVDRAVLDLSAFEDLAVEGAGALCAHDDRQAVQSFTAASALWRGVPFAPLKPGPERERLAELHDDVRSGLTTALLRIGRACDAVPVIRQVAADRPFDEHVQALLMTALAQSGRRADALAAYQRFHALLGYELGLTPGRELQTTQGRILAEVRSIAQVRTRPGGVLNL